MVYLVFLLEHGLGGVQDNLERLQGEKGVMRTHLPGMYYVSKQEGGQNNHQKHPARPLEARMLFH